MKKLLLLGLVVFAFAISAVAQTLPNDGKIMLTKKFMGSLKFQRGSDVRKPVYNWSMLSFKPDFENTLAAYPPALTEAKKAFIFNGVATLCMAGAAVILTLDLMENIDAANNPGAEGQISLGPIIGCFAGAIVSGLIGTSKLKHGVRIYNENIGTVSAAPINTQYEAESTTGSSGFGFKAGLNMASQDMPFSKGVTRLAFGGFATIPVSRDFTIQPEALYSMKGSKMQAIDGSLKYKLDYLDFPVLCKYTFPMSGPTKLFVFAGPSLGVLMSAKLRIEVDGESAEGDIKPLYNSTDIGLVFGGGVNIDKNVSIDGRYVMGLSDIASSLWDEEIPGFSIKNSAISFMVGYAF